MNLRNRAASIVLLGILLSDCATQPSAKSPSPLAEPTRTPANTASLDVPPTVPSTAAVVPAPGWLSQVSPLSLPEFNAHYPAGDLALSQDGKIMAVVSNNGDKKSVWLWNVNDLSQSLAGYQILLENPLSVALSPDGEQLAIGCTGKIVLLDWKTGNISATIPLPRLEAYQLEFGPDNTLVSAANFDSRVVVWDLSKDELKYTIDEPFTMGFALSPDGKTLATGTVNETQLWDFTTGQRLETHPSPSGGIGFGPTLAYSSDGTYLAVGGCGAFNFEACIQGQLFIWETSSQQLSINLSRYSSRIEYLAFSPDNHYLAVVRAGDELELLDLNSGQFIRVPSLENPAKVPADDFSSIYDLIVLQDGKRLAVSTHEGIQFLDIARMAWVPNLRFILTSGYSYSITTEGDNLNLRGTPSMDGEILKKLRTGEWLTIVSGPKVADDYVWWNVEIKDGTRGWVVEMPGWYEFIP